MLKDLEEKEAERRLREAEVEAENSFFHKELEVHHLNYLCKNTI